MKPLQKPSQALPNGAVVSFLLSRVNIDNCEEIPQAPSIHRTEALPNLNFGNRQHQVTIGMFRHTAHGLLILPLVHQKGTMHTLHLRLSPSQEILLLLTQAKECNLLRLLPSTLHSRANFSYQVAALNNSWRCSRASILIWKSER